jgi:outer membrane protein TolC
MADPQMNLLSEAEIVPNTSPSLVITELDRKDLLRLAMNNNPAVQQARLAIAISDINIDFAKSQRMPRLDLVASTGFHGLDDSSGNSHDNMGDFASYALGFSLEFPLGNREREAELMRRKLERRKAVSALQNTADLVAAAVKERIRKVETNHSEIQIQKDAAEAASTQLRALEQTESVRPQLTPEFLLVKLQAQQDLAEAQRAEVRAIVEFNIATAELAQATGTVLKLNEVRAGLPVASADESVANREVETK